ncbi:MAG TPA: Smr/MutS family protein [Bacteroidales bacterium]|nr:Smr/MutS family protein [Bacteroidales bacterium]HPT02968.1 Smr/MutS family protein [Bacteroidales bacterium]
MIYPGNFEEKIGFDVIRGLLKDKCLGPAGKRLIDAITFATRFQDIDPELLVTGEFRELLLTVPGFPMSDYLDLDEELQRIRTAGTFLIPENLVQLRHSLSVVSDVLNFIRSLDSYSFPATIRLAEDVFVDGRIISEINRILNEQGEIRDNASEKLFSVRKSIVSLRSQIDRRIAQSLTQAKTQSWISEEAQITIRNGRLVIPVPAANKRRIKGFIHDQSATGQTVYIEPADVFELNNDIRQLELSEQQEIVRILIQFTDFLRPGLDNISIAFDFLGRVDFLRAKAVFALETGGTKPFFRNDRKIDWIEARHPLLFLSHKRLNKPVIPLDIRLDEENRILIISGPNAGGKSVCLKTVGLLQYMLQCGLLVPMKETSETGVFTDLFIDIGDQQSIDNDLSTYSSHLINIKNLLSFAGKSSLFLIDEFGAGTEPQSGGAIAETVIESLNQKMAFGVVTTHYANLKLLASKGSGIVNGAMLFDTRKMKPLFKLSIGKPGSSFAFEIASNIDFPAEILSKAIEKAGTSKLNYDKLIQGLENERAEISLKEKQLQHADDLLASLISKYETLKSDLEKKRKSILEDAQAEARHMIADSNTLIEKTIREIRQSQAEKSKTRQLRQEITEMAAKLETDASPDRESIPATAPESQPEPVVKAFPEIGDPVKIEGQSEIGEIEEMTSADALVAFRTVKLRVPLNRLIPFEKTGDKPKGKSAYDYRYHNIVNEINARLANFRLSIDVRGHRGDEAVALVQKYIDEAILLNVPEVSILHGKGNGVLRRMIRDYLHTVSEVRQMTDESLERGGAGITVVRFR